MGRFVRLTPCQPIGGLREPDFFSIPIWLVNAHVPPSPSSMATLPQGNQEVLMVKDKVGRPPGELAVSKSIKCDIFPSVF